MKKHELKANVIISGPIFPEPVQVMMTHDMGHLVKVIGKGLRTEKFLPVNFSVMGLDKA